MVQRVGGAIGFEQPARIKSIEIGSDGKQYALFNEFTAGFPISELEKVEH